MTHSLSLSHFFLLFVSVSFTHTLSLALPPSFWLLFWGSKHVEHFTSKLIPRYVCYRVVWAFDQVQGLPRMKERKKKQLASSTETLPVCGWFVSCLYSISLHYNLKGTVQPKINRLLTCISDQTHMNIYRKIFILFFAVQWLWMMRSGCQALKIAKQNNIWDKNISYYTLSPYLCSILICTLKIINIVGGIRFFIVVIISKAFIAMCNIIMKLT